MFKSKELKEAEESRMGNFEKELTKIINIYCMENQSDTPDFILAQYLMKCIEIFNETTNKRKEWYEN